MEKILVRFFMMYLLRRQAVNSVKSWCQEMERIAHSDFEGKTKKQNKKYEITPSLELFYNKSKLFTYQTYQKHDL